MTRPPRPERTAAEPDRLPAAASQGRRRAGPTSAARSLLALLVAVPWPALAGAPAEAPGAPAADDAAALRTAPLLPGPILSPDGHFHVHAPDQGVGVAAGLAGQALAERLASLLQLSDPWETPVTIFIYQVAEPQQERRGLLHGYVEGTLHLEIHLACLRNVPERPFRLGLGQLLLCDLMYPRYGQGGTRTVPPPPAWLAAGLAELVGPGRGGGRLDLGEVSRRLTAGEPRQLLSAARLLDLDRIPGDLAEQRVIGSYASQFVRSLLMLSRGPERLGRSLRLLGTGQTEARRAFWESFGELFGDANGLEKWWALELAGRADFIGAGTLSFDETLRRLDEILLTPPGALAPVRGSPAIPPGKLTLTLGELWDWKRHPGFPQLVLGKRYQVMSLYTRANRAAAPVLDAYLAALDWLLRGSRARFTTQLERAAAQLAAARGQMSRVGEQVDLAELASGSDPAGEHDVKVLLEYLGRGEEADSESAAPIPPPQSRIRAHVDQFDQPVP